MLQRLRSRLHGEEGFTLIELLVVILIIGILAAIAIPSFLNQKGKGEDASAKSTARTAQTAMETWNTDHGDYNASATDLHNIEATVPTSITVTGGTDTYTIVVDSKDGRSFSLTRKTDGTVERSCKVTAGSNPGGCVLKSGSTTDGSW